MLKELENNSQKSLLKDLQDLRFECIVWDLDETLGNTQKVVKEEFDNIFGTNYKLRALDRFDALSHWAVEDGIASYKEANKVEVRLWTDPLILAKVEPYHGTLDYSKKSHQRGKTQFIVTSRNTKLKEVTKLWVSHNFPWIPFENVRVTPRHNITYDGAYKRTVISSIQPDFVFEDNPSHVIEILASTPESTKIVWFSRSLETSESLGKRVLVLPNGQSKFGSLVSHNIDTSPSLS